MLVTTRERHGDAVVRVRGAVGRPDVPDLREALLKAAAGQPAAVLCDLRGAVVERNALTILLTVADQLDEWPGCSLAVLAADPVLRRSLAAVGVTRRVPVAATVAEAGEALRSVRPPARSMLRLAPGVRAPAEARAFLEDAVRGSGVGAADDADDAGGVDLDAAALVLTELVTNAVLHAGTDLEVLVSVRPGRLRLAVADRGSDAPSVTRATADDEHGRGLALVDALTLRWGIVPRGPAGKVVWAVLGPDEVVGPSAALPVASDGRS